MKCGPSPSRAAVDDGASTQLRRKNEFPTAKRVRSSSSRLAAANENALRPVAATVVAPPVCSSGDSSSVPGAARSGASRPRQASMASVFSGRCIRASPC